MKKALLLCTSHNDLGLIRALRKLGYYIIATGNRENSPGERWVDKYIKADYSDKELILSIAQAESIDVICQCCNDFGVYTAAYVAEKLNLPGYDSYENTLILHNKDKFKEFAVANDIMTPKTESFDDEESALAAIREMDFPLIVKPTDASAGNGINKVANYDGVAKAVKEAFSKSRAKRIVVEPFIEGTQHGFCTFLVNRKVVACCTNNEYSILNPYRVEIDTFPADSWDKAYPILVEQIEKIADILQLKDGIFHLQYIMRGGDRGLSRSCAGYWAICILYRRIC
jgi:biotin carboxylase